MKAAAGAFGTCIASLGLSVVVVTDWLQLLAALIAVLTGAVSLYLMIRKVRA